MNKWMKRFLIAGLVLLFGGTGIAAAAGIRGGAEFAFSVIREESLPEDLWDRAEDEWEYRFEDGCRVGHGHGHHGGREDGCRNSGDWHCFDEIENPKNLELSAEFADISFVQTGKAENTIRIYVSDSRSVSGKSDHRGSSYEYEFYGSGSDQGSVRVELPSGYCFRMLKAGIICGKLDGTVAAERLKTECENGTVTLSLQGKEEDYGISAETERGTVTVGENRFGGEELPEFETLLYPERSRQIDADCENGSISVTFAE